MNLKDYIRSIPDYPKKGILFRDITTLIKDPEAFKFTNDKIIEIRFFLKNDAEASLTIYDANGKLILNLFEGFQSAGSKLFSWNGTNQSGQKVTTGIYIYSLYVNGVVGLVIILASRDASKNPSSRSNFQVRFC